MAKKHKCPECPAGEKWAVPYADFLSLLLALFIALWAISESNPAKTEALRTEFVKIFDFAATQSVEKDTSKTKEFQGSSTTSKDEIDNLKSVIMSQQDNIKKLKAALDQLENQTTLRPPAKVEFQRGSAEIISADVQDFLKYMAKFSASLLPQVQIEIIGFSDNSDNIIRSFELGSRRAQAVAQYFINNGVNPASISIKSFGSNKPIDNDASKLENNRVEIFYKIDTADEETKKGILDKLKDFKGNE